MPWARNGILADGTVPVEGVKNIAPFSASKKYGPKQLSAYAFEPAIQLPLQVLAEIADSIEAVSVNHGGCRVAESGIPVESAGEVICTGMETVCPVPTTGMMMPALLMCRNMVKLVKWISIPLQLGPEHGSSLLE